MTMRTARSEAILIALLASAAVSAGAAAVMLRASAVHTVMTLIGVAAYIALVRIADYDPHLQCDTVQSGEAAVGTFALYTAMLFLTTSPPVLMILTFTALFAYQLFMKTALAPAKKEIALGGAAAQGILAVTALFIMTTAGPRPLPAGSVVTGYFSAADSSLILPAVSLALAAMIPALYHVLGPEMRLLSQGTPFASRPAPVRAAAAAGALIARSILAGISLLFAGWTCGVGISVRRLYRGRHPDLVTVLSLLCVSQMAMLTEIVSGPLPAAAAAWVCSYAAFSQYYCRRIHVYDRYQQA